MTPSIELLIHSYLCSNDPPSSITAEWLDVSTFTASVVLAAFGNSLGAERGVLHALDYALRNLYLPPSSIPRPLIARSRTFIRIDRQFS